MTTRARALSRAMRSRRLAAAVVAVLAGLGVTVLWWAFVTTGPGQRVEEIALQGSTIGRWRLAEGTRTVLDVVSVPFLTTATLVGVIVALGRRRWLLAGAVPLMVAGANLTTQVLKYQVFFRPELGLSTNSTNSLPSGHTTAAGSVAAIAVLVVPPHWRWAAALAGWGYAGGTGLATIVNGWHRASDVAAAMLVVLAWAALTLAILGPQGPDQRHRATRTVSVLLLSVAAGTGVPAVIALGVTWSSTGSASTPDRTMLLAAYGGTWLGIAAITSLVAAVMLWLCTIRSPRLPAGPQRL